MVHDHSNHKLVYFNLRGRAEPIRFLLAAAGVDYEDKRVEMSEWHALKPKIPTHRLPYLEVTLSSGGTGHFEESMAIARYAAKHVKMTGETEDEIYYMERMISQCAEIDDAISRAREAPEQEQPALFKKIEEETIPEALQLICKSLGESKGPFVVGSRGTLGDFYLMTVMDHVTDVNPDLLTGGYDIIHKHRQAILSAYPKLDAYIKKRPKTDY